MQHQADPIRSDKPLKSRRAAREALVRALYAWEVGDLTPDEALDSVFDLENLAEEAQEFVRDEFMGVVRRLEVLDNRIIPFLQNWEWRRVAVLDRVILRIACFELFHVPSIPPGATINEAVVLTKLYSSNDSARFVNGVLGRLFDHSPKANWDEDLFPVEPPLEGDIDEPDEPEVEVLKEGTKELEEALAAGAWVLKSGEEASEPVETPE